VAAQLLEILFFAGIAFLIISKFISILGTTDDDDPARKMGSFFGEPKGLKDVTNNHNNEGQAAQLLKSLKNVKKLGELDDENLKAIFEVLPDFDSRKFLNGAKGAFGMIIEALDKKDSDTINELVDKRFIDQIKTMKDVYGKSASNLEAKIVDSYSFGNSIYVKVLFDGKTDKIKKLQEEWVFTKNIQQTGPDWYLSNIERLK
jgi:predicted lipid-binding transport protein (Tim44 family)